MLQVLVSFVHVLEKREFLFTGSADYTVSPESPLLINLRVSGTSPTRIRPGWYKPYPFGQLSHGGLYAGARWDICCKRVLRHAVKLSKMQTSLEEMRQDDLLICEKN